MRRFLGTGFSIHSCRATGERVEFVSCVEIRVGIRVWKRVAGLRCQGHQGPSILSMPVNRTRAPLVRWIGKQ